MLKLHKYLILIIMWFLFFLSEYLKVRSHDPEEAIRHDVIVSIVTAAKKDLLLVNDHLLNFVRERTLDKRVRCTIVLVMVNYNKFNFKYHIWYPFL